MPRPAQFTVDELLDAGVELLVDGGPAAVTMSAVARAVGAPSGSMYHRFAGRAALCGELWLRTEERFIAGFVAALAGSGDARSRAVAGARFTVAWCRENPGPARVLLAGADALGLAEWPSEISARRRRVHRELRRALSTLPADADRVNAAVIDIPYAIVRRYLSAGEAIPGSADEIVAECAAALIAD